LHDQPRIGMTPRWRRIEHHPLGLGDQPTDNRCGPRSNSLLHPLPECCKPTLCFGVFFGNPDEHPNPPYPLPLLCATSERPSCHACEPCNELPPSFDHLVGERHQGRRHVQADCLGGLEVDNQLELGRLQDRKVGRLFAL
jgi:hypothetical protein